MCYHCRIALHTDKSTVDCRLSVSSHHIIHKLYITNTLTLFFFFETKNSNEILNTAIACGDLKSYHGP